MDAAAVVEAAVAAAAKRKIIHKKAWLYFWLDDNPSGQKYIL